MIRCLRWVNIVKARGVAGLFYEECGLPGEEKPRMLFCLLTL